MREQLILNGENITYKAAGGTVELYAVKFEDEKPQGRLYHFKTVCEDGEFADYAPVKTQSAVWVCVAKCGGASACRPVAYDGYDEARVLAAEEFALFVTALEKELAESAALFQRRSDYTHQVLSGAAVRLAEVNTRLSKWSREEFDGDDEYVKACKALCGYLKVEPKIPSKDIAEDFANLAEEILYLSGVRYKDVSLPDKWWKHNNGAMLGLLDDGTPVALLPHRISGYRMYDPRRNAVCKVDAGLAAKISTTATAVFRTFASKRIGLKDIAGFILGENIYKEIAVILLCSLFANVFQVIPSIVSAQIFDVIVPENLRGMLVEVILILIAFELANVGFSIIVNLGVSRINTKSGLSVQTALWDRLLSLRIPFYDQFTTGELLQKIKSIDRVKDMISMDTLQIIFSNMFSFVNIIVLFNFSASITLYVLLMFLGLFTVNAFAGRQKLKLYKKHTDLQNKAMSFNHQCVQGMYRVKVSCAEERVYNIWSAYEAEKRGVMSRISMIDNALGSFQLFFDFASAAVIYFLISQTQNIGMGMFIAYISAFLVFQKSMRKLLKALNILPELISVCQNVKPILEAEPEYIASKTVPKDMTGTLEVNHATFRYGEYGRNILSDISFRVEEGESIGIVGLSGGGKSTLLKLLMGFYDLTDGKIYYGGYDLETVDLRYLRKQMGVVLQDGRLTVGDIYSNVTDNDANVEYKAVEEALEKVGLSEMVSGLPDGLHTRLEYCPLSDGQRQRLLIARAIVKKNRFIFLDEATSSLDNISQGMIMKNLKNIPSTKIIIAQRLATVQYCDKIIVLDQGRIARQGSYAEIAETHGILRELARQV